MQFPVRKILFIAFFLFAFSGAKAATVDDIAKQITALQQQIALLRTQASAIQPAQTQKITGLEKIPTNVVLKTDLKLGDMNDDVAFSQRILKSQGFFCAKCYVTGYFGTGTKNALQAFQRKYIGKATGMIDGATRDKLNGILQTSRIQIAAPATTPIPTPVPTQTQTSTPTPAPNVSNDTTPPSASITINGGVSITTNSLVMLTLSCADPSGVAVRYSNVSVFTHEPFVGFDKIRQWQLESGDGLKTVYYQCQDNAGNVTQVSATITLESSPPVRSNGQPSGVLQSGTGRATLSLTTNKLAICRYSEILGKDYDSMQLNNALSQGPSTSHSIAIFPSGDGAYSYAVRCQDTLGNKNLDDFVVSFRVGALNNTNYNINVLVLKYFPLTADKNNIDINVTGDVGDAYSTVWQKTIDITNNLKSSLQKASTYLGYANTNARPSLFYNIVDIKKYEEKVPTKDVPVLRYPDYLQVLTRENICNYVDSQNVQEVWLFAYQGPTKADNAPYLNILESKMAGPNGDVSNSPGYNDMPKCSKTYRVYTFNYGRGTAEAMESWGHQMEAELTAINQNLFRNIFQGLNYPQTLGVIGRCGSVHNPPNATKEYDRANATPQQSDCLDWKPDNLGALSSISCQNWGCDPLQYMIWNWQNLPGSNNTKTYQGKQLRNWWDIHGDFDNVMAHTKQLTITP